MLLLSRNNALLSKWSGGTTAQLMIFPESSEYKDRDFDYRISVATIDDETSTFTSLPDYHRYMVALSDKINITNNGQPVQLNRCELYEFEGADSVESFGKAVDLGIMCRRNKCHADIRILAYEMNETVPQDADYAYVAVGHAEEGPDGIVVKSQSAVVVFIDIIYDLKLVKPDASHKEMWEKAMAEFKEAGETPTPSGINYGVDVFEDFLKENERFENMAFITKSEETGNMISPSTTMFLTNADESKLFGAVSCRKFLTEKLRERGGNIGYGVVPSERRRGYATRMLGMFLDECRKIGLAAVVITCAADNVPSKKTILNNGGILYGTGVDTDGEEYERYYILTL
ncbi:MAG: HutD family protein [Clostridia bacterium]|nr:HutD family protein [Clostridia bacterium]